MPAAGLTDRALWWFPGYRRLLGWQEIPCGGEDRYWVQGVPRVIEQALAHQVQHKNQFHLLLSIGYNNRVSYSQWVSKSFHCWWKKKQRIIRRIVGRPAAAQQAERKGK